MKTIRFIKILTLVLLTIIANAMTKETQGTVANRAGTQSDNAEMSKVKAQIIKLLTDKAVIYNVKYDAVHKTGLLGSSLGTPTDVIFLNEGIELRFNNQDKITLFSEMADYTIKASEKGYIPFGNYSFSLGRRAAELADDLIYLQKHLDIQSIQQRNDSLFTLFETNAVKYRALKVKPTVSEEQRKFVVQANLFNQQKNYHKAIELYKKAIEVNQVAYPAAYSNVALLFAQVDKFGDAISYMKKYLLLEPEGSDARSAQDKIYEWEALIQK